MFCVSGVSGSESGLIPPEVRNLKILLKYKNYFHASHLF